MLSERTQEVCSSGNLFVIVQMIGLEQHMNVMNTGMTTTSVSWQHMQIVGMPYAPTYHQQRGTMPWQNPQPVFGGMGPPSQSMFNQYLGAPVASPNGYNNHVTYPAQPRESQYEGTNASHMLVPMQNLPHGAPFSSQPHNLAGPEFYISQQFKGGGHEHTQPRPRSQCMPFEDVHGQGMATVVPPLGAVQCVPQTSVSATVDVRGGRGAPGPDKEAEAGDLGLAKLTRSANNQTSRAPTTSGSGILRNLHESTMEEVLPVQTSNNSILLSTNSSKSSAPYTSSQRKQLRVEEKSYLREVKRSIAEGRVPQVRLEQNNSGDIVQYKAQFLNALKLAALAIVSDADIDVKNPSTMQEIMKEVRRQFIIEKPLPEGMVAGYLQRLYKRNRAVYHRHWTLHGDANKPDDCSLAAWSQLVDYWQSMEGNKECERNKANASAKKCAPVSFPALAPLYAHPVCWSLCRNTWRHCCPINLLNYVDFEI